MTGIEDLLRELAPQVLGAVARRHRPFEDAEDAVQEALLAAATQWPRQGVPDHPRGWLIAVATRRMTDRVRNEEARRRREELAALHEPREASPPAPEHDDSLTLLFLCCHPALTPASAIPLTLRAVGGLTTAEIARAFLVPEARWRSASVAPSSASTRRAPASCCRAATNGRSGCARCSTPST